MNICYIVDNNYFEYFLVSFNSLVRNKSKSTILDCYLVLNAIPENLKSLILAFEADDVKLHIYEDIDIEMHASDADSQEYFSDTVYLRLKIPELLENVDKVLYIDSDTIVKKDISELYDNHDISEYPLAATKEFIITQLLDNWEPADYLREEFPLFKEKYFNSGVLLLNLKWLRENYSFAECYQTFVNHPEFKFVDQDILNWLYDECYLEIHPKFNFQFSMYMIDHYGSIHYNDEKTYIEKYNSHYGTSYQNFMQAFLDSSILHYLGDKQRLFKHKVLKEFYDNEKQHLMQYLARKGLDNGL